MKKVFFSFCGLVISLGISAQVYNFARLDNTNGLSNNQVGCIFKDSRGFMWFGTNYGLNRYDGYNMKVYKTIKNDTTSLIQNSTPEIQEDVNANLWIRGNPDYVVYDRKTEKFHRTLSSLLAPLGINFIPALVEIDKEKNFYFYESNIGIYKYDVNQKKLLVFRQSQKLNSISKGTIVSLKSAGGCFWVLFQSGLLERFNEKTNSVDFRNNYITRFSAGTFFRKSVFIDSDGCPWVYPGINDKGVMWYNFATNDWVYFGSNRNDFPHPATDKQIAADIVSDVDQEKNGNIWIGTDHGGVNVYNKRTGTVTVVRNDPQNPTSLSQNSAITLYSDDNGIMWVGTYKNGVSYYHPGMFKFEKSPLYFYHHPELENKDCNTLYKDSRGVLWIGTNGSGLLRYDTGSNDFRLYRNQKENPSSLSSDIIIAATEDKKGHMWFGTYLGGLNQMIGDRFVRYFPDVNNPNSLSNKSIYSIICEPDDNLWIGTLGGGVDQLDPTRKNFRRHDIGNVQGMSSNYILSMSSRDQGQIFLCSSLGIDVLNTQNGTVGSAFKDRRLRTKLSDLIIYNSLLDYRNRLWLATDNGINIFNMEDNSFTYLKKSDGLPSEQVVSLVEDNNHNIWAGTRNGLACIYISVNKHSKKTEYNIVSFDENDGLPSSICNQNAAFKDKNGRIYIGCTKGYVDFDPNTIRFNEIVPRPRISSISIGNQEIAPGDEYKGRVVLDESVTEKNRLVLNYDEKNFTIRFSAMSYIHPEKNRYRYKLKGLDSEWIETRNGMVSYSSLSQGSYELIVYASNNDNVWTSEPLILQIIIRPPFWLTWWAISFYVLFISGCVWYIIQYKLLRQKQEFENEQRIREARQLHEMDEMKFRFFTNISHEFRTPLTLILNPTEKLLKEAQTAEQRNMLSIIQRNANGLLELVNQLLDFRKLDLRKDTLNLSVGDAVDFVRDICYSFTELANKKEINFSFSTGVSELRMEFDPEKLRKVVYNLLSNAFKFTPDRGRIEVGLSLLQQHGIDNRRLKITISDTGFGIPEKDIEHIFERFYRVENGENGNQTGTGVGLHIVSEYVTLHGGEVNVESKVGHGSQFSVLIPANLQIEEEILSRYKPSSNEKAEELNEVEEHTGDEKPSKLPVLLIVDDNEDFRNFISTIFSGSYRILMAPDGEIALQLTLKNIPDLVICDVMMPNVDGYEYCRRVKEDIRVSHIPVILLTAKTGDENKYKGLEAGAEDYISKPFNTEMLTLKVARIVERQRQARDQFKRKVDINPSEVEITSMDEKFVRKAVAVVEAAIGNPDFLVEDLCREMGMSRVYFYKKILSLTDKTPSEFIRYIRLKRAADLLEKSQLYVNEVAYQVGFNDPKYFRKYFKDEFGLSPNEYKKKFEK